MIRINRIHERSTLRLIVEGTLSGVWVNELEKCWLEADPTDAQIRVELSGVGYIDDSGKKLLKRMVKQGAELSATGVMTKGIIDEIISQNGK